MNAMKTRRSFLTRSAILLASTPLLPHASYAIHHKTPFVGEVVGHGDFKYRVDKHWGIQDPGNIPVKHCHEMVQDSKGRLILVTTHTRNNFIIYDKSGRVHKTWGHDYPGIHGLTLCGEGADECIFITDTDRHQIYKLNMKGEELLKIDYPKEAGIYQTKEQFRPTEVAIGPNGDIYVADGHGLNYVIQYDAQGRYKCHFGGLHDDHGSLNGCHGITVDYRQVRPTLLVSSQATSECKRFSMDGQFIESIKIPGCWICRPVIKGEYLHFAVIGTKSWWEYDGIVVILDKKNNIVAAPGANETTFHNGALDSLTYDGRTFMNPHDVCIDEDENLYVPQWYSGNTYPVKLTRI